MTSNIDSSSSNPFAAPSEPSPAAIDHLLPVHGRARAVTAGLVAVAGIGVLLGLIEQAVHFGGPSTVYDDDASLRVFAALSLVGLGLASVVAHLTTGIAWCMWSFRIAKNLHREDPAPLEYTPGWVVGWWFVPFANLFKPYQVTRALFQGSALDGERPAAPDYLIGWWIAWVAGNMSANIAFRVMDTPLAPMADLVSSALGIVSAVLALKVVSDLTRAHTAWIDARARA